MQWHRFVPAVGVLLGVSMSLPATSLAASSRMTPAAGYQAQDLATNVDLLGYDADSSTIYGWDKTNKKLGAWNLAGTLQNDLGTLPSAYQTAATDAGTSVFNSFVRMDPSGTSLWAGFTRSDNADDRIYQVDLATGTWTQKAEAQGNFDLAFNGSTPYAVANSNAAGGSVTGSGAAVLALDTSGANNHDLIADVSGFSAGLAFDSSGRLYYGQSTLSSTNNLLRFDTSDIAAGTGADSVTDSDATTLASLANGFYDVTVDDADNVLFSYSDLSNGYAGRWDGSIGDDPNHAVLATGSEKFFTFVDGEGDITDGGTLYQTTFGDPGVTAIALPEPASAIVFAAAPLLLLGRGRSKRQ
jgi:hypothetical protein